jgi:hypothetical protein
LLLILTATATISVISIDPALDIIIDYKIDFFSPQIIHNKYIKTIIIKKVAPTIKKFYIYITAYSNFISLIYASYGSIHNFSVGVT